MLNERIYHGFFDDAAVFPPGNASVKKAVTIHLLRREDPVTDPFVGPLVLTPKDIAAAAEIAAGDQLDLAVSLPLDQAEGLAAAVDKHPNLRLVAVEARATEDVDASLALIRDFASAAPERQFSLELGAEAVTDERLEVLRDAGVLLKFRTGGIKAELYPTTQQVLHVLSSATRVRAPFKLTAGLHRAMRYTDPATGFYHFGFLNIAAAVILLQQGDGSAARAILDSDDAEAVVEIVRGDDSWREMFRSFGTCNVAEPMVTLAQYAEVDEETVAHF